MPRSDFRKRALAPTRVALETDRPRVLQPGNWWISFACLQRPSRVALRDFRMWESERCRAMLPSARDLRRKNWAECSTKKDKRTSKSTTTEEAESSHHHVPPAHSPHNYVN